MCRGSLWVCWMINNNELSAFHGVLHLLIALVPPPGKPPTQSIFLPCFCAFLASPRIFSCTGNNLPCWQECELKHNSDKSDLENRRWCVSFSQEWILCILVGNNSVYWILLSLLHLFLIRSKKKSYVGRFTPMSNPGITTFSAFVVTIRNVHLHFSRLWRSDIQRSALIERLTAEKRTPVNVGGQWQQCMQ